MRTGEEHGWLPDLLYREGRFHRDTALFADDNGIITRFSNTPEDLARAHRLPRRALLPGLVNVHSHAFQRAIRARTEHRTGASRDTFWTWREAMYHAATSLSPEDLYHVARMAFLEMLASGITTVGEFHYIHHAPGGAFYDEPNLIAELIVQAAAETGIRIALLRTAYVRAGWQRVPNPGQARFITPTVDAFLRHTEDLRGSLAKRYSRSQAWVGIAPHSIRAVPLPYLEETVRFAMDQDLKIHMHVAEQPGEIEACLSEFGMRPVELLHRHEILSPRFTGIHLIHLTNDEIGYLAQAGARACACGTTERNLGDGICPADCFAEAGVGVCFGSDSNVQINLLEDARQLEYHMRLKRLERAVLTTGTRLGSLAVKLFEGATEVGARSLGAPGGALRADGAADFFTMDLDDLSVAGARPGSLLSHVVFCGEKTAIRDVFTGGRQVLKDGRHPLQEEIVRSFSEVQNKLWTASE